MKKIIFRVALFISTIAGAALNNTYAQVYHTSKGTGTFSVSAPAKTINASSQSVVIELDRSAAKLQLSVPVSSFLFTNNFVSDSANEVIHKRFNSYYMESSKYPDVTYQASVVNMNSIDFEKDGRYPIQTKGTLNIHGVQQEVTAGGTVEVKGGKVNITARIKVLPADYKIRIPAYIGQMYFREVFIETTAALQPK